MPETGKFPAPRPAFAGSFGGLCGGNIRRPVFLEQGSNPLPSPKTALKTEVCSSGTIFLSFFPPEIPGRGPGISRPAPGRSLTANAAALHLI